MAPGRDVEPLYTDPVGGVEAAEIGGDKGAWIAAILPGLKSTFPTLKAIAWFHMNKETDWRIDSSTGSKDAFVQMAKDAYFNP